ncbi:hypothetical protein Mpsy_0689 [Methanolobus psychrophilus R15]|nr:hypothetical protein Mpsy_0689 [Methanolobus psychrophilus R15]
MNPVYYMADLVKYALYEHFCKPNSKNLKEKALKPDRRLSLCSTPAC